ncbi:cystine transport system substrate-binding protein [Weissella beninensis]|uniref:Transporter substrate-binding domain-containing protein n=1 Tax=Periweissella beninensis TaxID=504936 RepID=A0ABT0VJ88_9LACO|nr:transporter substrate-binding domain-containing protein [Periweissella beninensis]MBM7543337.1 cystine transport system substrate-binding protein [Periweissella beninensis]MCM2437901.1 transporter substrate-binding domain-containing protein [Periweissella beninensis]
MKLKLRPLLLATAALLVTITLAACSTTKQNTTNSTSATLNAGKLTIGLEGTYAPYSYRKNGQLTGFEVELGKAIAKEMNLKPVFVQSKWDSLIAGLDSKKYDLVLNDVAITAQRQKSYAFTTPYLYSKSVLIVKKGSKITNVKQIKGKKTAESLTSNNGADAKKLGSTIVAIPGFAEAVDLIQSNRVVGALNSREAFLTYKKANPKTNLTYIDAGNAIAAQKIAGILSKNKPGLQAKINKAMQNLKKDGTFAKLSHKYFGDDVTTK